MIRRASLTIAIVIGLAAPSAAWAEAGCYDVKVRARHIDQVPSDVGDCGDDCIIMSWPWFIDLEVKRVIDGTLPSKMVRVLTVQHTYRATGTGIWLLRRNNAGGYNVLEPQDGARLRRCSAEVSSVEPFIGPGPGHTLDDLREAGIRRYGHRIH